MLTQKKYTLKEQAGYLFVGKIVSFVVRFSVPLILVRVFTQKDFGIYQQLLLAGNFFVPLLRMGMPQGMFFFYPNAKEKTWQLFSQNFYYSIIIGILFFPVFFFLRDALVLLFKNQDFQNYAFLCYTYLVFFLISSMFETVLILERKSNYVFIYIFLGDTLRAILIILTAIFIRKVEFVFAMHVFYNAIISLGLFYYLKKSYEIKFLKDWDWGYFKKQVNYSFPLGMGDVLKSASDKINNVLLNLFLSASDFAKYKVANFRLPLINEFYASLGKVTRPQIATYYHNRENEKARILWHKQMSKFIIVTLPLVVFSFVMAEEIITFLYTDKYKESVNVFRVLLFVFLLQASSWGTITKGYNATKFILFSNIISMVAGLFTGFFAIRSYGLYGAAVAAVLTLAIDVILQLLKSKSLLKLSYKTFLPWKTIFYSFFITIIASIPLIFISQLEISKLLRIIFSGVIFFPIVFILFCKSSLIEKNEINFFIDKISKTFLRNK